MEYDSEEEDEVKEDHHLWLDAHDDAAAAVSAATHATAAETGSAGAGAGAGVRGGALFDDDPYDERQGREGRRDKRGKGKQSSREPERQYDAGPDAAAGGGRGYLYEREHER